VSDYSGDLYNKDSIIQFLLPTEASPVDKAYYEKFIQGRIKSLKDVVEVIFEVEHDSITKTDKWICPITSKELGPAVKAVYIVPCGHAFSQEAIKQMNAEQCSQCGQSYQNRDIVPILPSTEADKYFVMERIESLRAQSLTHSLKKAAGSKKRKANGEAKAEVGGAKATDNAPVKDGKPLNEPVPRSGTPQSGTSTTRTSNGIKNAATANLTARVLEEEESKKRRRLENENISSLYTKNSDSDKARNADFMTRGYSMAAKAK
jgi:Rtf2 RING-finger